MWVIEKGNLRRKEADSALENQEKLPRKTFFKNLRLGGRIKQAVLAN